MASTNKTTNYDLSQYIGTDKPTYLTDYNQDMVKIDTGIHSAKSQAETNSSAIGNLSNLNTETKTDLVSAMNEVVSDVATNTGNIATNTSNISTNTTHIGTVANLTTTAKTDLVVATNEVNAKVGNLGNLTTTEKSSTVGAINEVQGEISKFNLTTFKEYTQNSSSSDLTVSSGATLTNTSISVARNQDGSIFKFYGNSVITKNGSSGDITITFKNTGLNPTSAFNVSNAGIIVHRRTSSNDETANSKIYTADISIKSNGDVEYKFTSCPANGQLRLFLFPCLYFAKNFGDTPTPE